MRENGFVATTTSATRPSARSATVWPASVSSSVAGSAWNQPLAADQPADHEQRAEHAEDDRRRLVDAGVGRQRPWLSLRKGAELRGDEEQQAGVSPEEQAAAQAARRRRERDPAAAAAGEQVDGADQERQQGCQQHELDRPAADDPRSEIDVARRSLRQLEPGIERADEILRRPAELAQALAAEAGIAEALGGAVGNGGERHRGDAARDEGSLLAEGEREAEIEQLAQRARPATARFPTARAPAPRRCAPARRPVSVRYRPRSAAVVPRARRSRRG